MERLLDFWEVIFKHPGDYRVFPGTFGPFLPRNSERKTIHIESNPLIHEQDRFDRTNISQTLHSLSLRKISKSCDLYEIVVTSVRLLSTLPKCPPKVVVEMSYHLQTLLKGLKKRMGNGVGRWG